MKWKKLKKRALTPEVKTNYVRIGLGMAGVATNNTTAELLWRMFEKMAELGGDFSVRDASEIQAFVERKSKAKSEKEKVNTEHEIDIIAKLSGRNASKARVLISKLISKMQKP